MQLDRDFGALPSMLPSQRKRLLELCSSGATAESVREALEPAGDVSDDGIVGSRVDAEIINQALILACYAGYKDLIEPLLASGADVQAVDAAGRSALARSSEAGHLRAAAALVRCGADVNAADAAGFTPVFLAARAGHQTVAAYLASSGAQLEITVRGMTAADVAWANDFREVAKMLEDKLEMQRKPSGLSAPLPPQPPPPTSPPPDRPGEGGVSAAVAPTEATAEEAAGGAGGDRRVGSSGSTGSTGGAAPPADGSGASGSGDDAGGAAGPRDGDAGEVGPGGSAGDSQAASAPAAPADEGTPAEPTRKSTAELGSTGDASPSGSLPGAERVAPSPTVSSRASPTESEASVVPPPPERPPPPQESAPVRIADAALPPPPNRPAPVRNPRNGHARGGPRDATGASAAPDAIEVMFGRAPFGFTLYALSSPPRVCIADVKDDSPALAAGLRPADIIFSIAGVPVQSLAPVHVETLVRLAATAVAGGSPQPIVVARLPGTPLPAAHVPIIDPDGGAVTGQRITQAAVRGGVDTAAVSLADIVAGEVRAALGDSGSSGSLQSSSDGETSSDEDADGKSRSSTEESPRKRSLADLQPGTVLTFDNHHGPVNGSGLYPGVDAATLVAMGLEPHEVQRARERLSSSPLPDATLRSDLTQHTLRGKLAVERRHSMLELTTGPALSGATSGSLGRRQSSFGASPRALTPTTDMHWGATPAGEEPEEPGSKPAALRLRSDSDRASRVAAIFGAGGPSDADGDSSNKLAAKRRSLLGTVESSAAHREGVLRRRTRWGTWVQRYFVLDPGRFSYSRSRAGGPRGWIVFTADTVIRPPAVRGGTEFSVADEGVVIMCRAASARECDEWVAALQINVAQTVASEAAAQSGSTE